MAKLAPFGGCEIAAALKVFLLNGQVDREVLENAHHLLRPLCIRRLKEEVETTLPPRVPSSHTILCL